MKKYSEGRTSHFKEFKFISSYSWNQKMEQLRPKSIYQSFAAKIHSVSIEEKFVVVGV